MNKIEQEIYSCSYEQRGRLESLEPMLASLGKY